MVLELLVWAWERYRPREGWLPFFLLAAAVACLAAAVGAVNWIPESGVVNLSAALGLLLGAVLAKRPVSRRLAWTLITLYGLLVTLSDIGQLRPPLQVLLGGRETLAEFWYQNGALLLDRAGSWLAAAVSGGTSQETIVFAAGLGLMTWFVAAYAGWSTFRHQQPLVSLTLIGVGLALNSYFGGAPIWYAALYVGLAALLAATMQYAGLEQDWEAGRVDYSREIRFELLMHAAAVALVLLTATMLLPNVPYSGIARRFADLDAVDQTEEMLERLFGGVRQPARGGREGIAGGGRGVMPRAFLLGNPPELAETVMMTATVSGPLPARANRWHGIVYDVYTGRGWALSEERAATVSAGQPIPLPAVRDPITVTQSVHWIYDDRLTRYTLGLPLRFDHETTTFWHGLSELSRVQGETQSYTALSRLSGAPPDALRATAADGVPPAILSRYTALPDDFPERVRQQAEQAAGHLTQPYDQAVALESFLRQYPYSLDVPPPPPEVDPVEFFLFELQRGYCDYYASAMTVMARSLGLPARLVTGFLAQPSDEVGVQTIVQLNAHSWTEIYFADYGWVAFEPTGAFPATVSVAETAPEELFGERLPPPAAPIPANTPAARPFPWARIRPWLLGLLIIGLPAVWLMARAWRSQPWQQDGVLWAYRQLQTSGGRLGEPSLPGQTPLEFQASLVARLSRLQEELPAFWRRLYPESLRSDIERLTALFVRRQYGGRLREGSEAARDCWSRLRRPLWWLRWLGWFRGDW